MKVGCFFLISATISQAGESLSQKPLSKAGGIPALPGYSYSFPKDHGSHDKFSLEWWYFTGHLFTESKKRFGYELTFFRKAIYDPWIQKNPSRWSLRQLYFAHVALTDVQGQTFRFGEKLSREGLGKSGAKQDRMQVWIDNWTLEPILGNHKQLRIKAAHEDFGIDLVLTAEKLPIIHGQQGISRKGREKDAAAHYYSLTRLETKGEILVGSEQFDVSGLSWMDHEFGSGSLGEDQVGWDWFSLQLGSKIELMVYLLRHSDGTIDPASSGTLIFPNGESKHLQLNEIEVRILRHWQSSLSGVRYPSEWVLEIPSSQLRVFVKPVIQDQELRTVKSVKVTYWEGAVNVDGEYKGSPIKGMGYVELTGYANPLQMIED